MQHRQLPLGLQRKVAAAKKQDRPKDQSADQTDQLSAGYMTAAATGLERNNTVTLPLGHMITESDVPDYAELQRHDGH